MTVESKLQFKHAFIKIKFVRLWQNIQTITQSDTYKQQFQTICNKIRHS